MGRTRLGGLRDVRVSNRSARKRAAATRSSGAFWRTLGLAALCFGCGSEADEPEGEIPSYPITDSRYTTLQQTWLPLDPPEATRQARMAGDFKITDIERYAELGIGLELGPGEPWAEHDELAPDWQSHTPSARRSLLFFWHASDPQVVDEESPIRLEGVTAFPIGSAFRPQSHLTTQAFESQVRTVAAIQADLKRPIDFTIITGDISDGGHRNELGWVFDTLNGGVIDPDSGKNDDPVKGAGNDFNDPFQSAGLAVPWYATIGNHEVLYTGIATASAEVQAAAVGGEVFQGLEYFTGIAPSDGIQGGFRDGSTPFADVRTTGPTPPDPLRFIPDLPELVSILHAEAGDPMGHGYTAEDVDAGRGHYSFHPVEGLGLRMIALNTLSQEPAGSEGALDAAQWTWLEAQLAEAAAADELVFVASHHKSGDIKLGVHRGPELAALLAQHDNVLLHLTGHGHTSASELILPEEEEAAGHRGYWEVMTPSTLDFPLQSRFWELVDEGGGYVALYATLLDHNAPPGSLAHSAREIAAGHGWFQDMDQRQSFEAGRVHRNLILRFKLSDALAARLAAAPGADSIASEETLLAY